MTATGTLVKGTWRITLIQDGGDERELVTAKLYLGDAGAWLGSDVFVPWFNIARIDRA